MSTVHSVMIVKEPKDGVSLKKATRTMQGASCLTISLVFSSPSNIWTTHTHIHTHTLIQAKTSHYVLTVNMQKCNHACKYVYIYHNST